MILLLGGTGSLGGPVLRCLLERKIEVRSFSRGASDWKSASIADLRRRGVDMVLADVNDERRLEEAMVGCKAVICLINTFQQTRNETYEMTHVAAMDNIVELAEKAGIQRLIHVSCLNSSEQSSSEYLRTKWQAEQLVKRGQFYWTILKTSFLFSDRCHLLNWLRPLIKFPAIMPVLGSGLNEIQPVFADDVASFLVDIIYDKTAVSKTFELGGPNVYAMADLMGLARKACKLSGPPVSMPTPMIDILMRLSTSAGLGGTQLRELLPLLTTESVCVDNALENRFQSELTTLEDALPKIVSRF
jgi:NADH dehydrogenase